MQILFISVWRINQSIEGEWKWSQSEIGNKEIPGILIFKIYNAAMRGIIDIEKEIGT